MSRGVMAHLNQYLLITAMVFACCTIMLVHLFVFPLYDTKLTTHQAKTVGEIEQSLCMTNTRRLAKAKRHKCPPEGIVTVAQGGRLGNQIWEYASVWGVARVTGLVPYVPRCIRSSLDAVFSQLSIHPLSKVAHCIVQWNYGSLDTWNGTSIMLPRFVVMPDLVLTWVAEIRKEFVFKTKLTENAQKILQTFGQSLIANTSSGNGSRYNSLKIEPIGKNAFSKDWVTSRPSATPATRSTVTPSAAAAAASTATPSPATSTTAGSAAATRLADITFVGVHVRRTDYKGYLWRTRKMNLADASYFHRAMDHFRAKFAHVAFVVVSDEASWCLDNLSADDVLVVRSRITSPGLDLALMASCNHSIIDYGTFGVWGAVLAGGETVLYNISRHSSVRVAQLLPNWRVMD